MRIAPCICGHKHPQIREKYPDPEIRIFCSACGNEKEALYFFNKKDDAVGCALDEWAKANKPKENK